MVADVVAQHLVQLVLYGTALDVYDGHRVALPRSVDAGIALQVRLHACDGRVPDDRVRSSEGQPMRCGLGLHDQHPWVVLALEVGDYSITPGH